MQKIPDIKYLIDAISNGLGVAVAAPQEIKTNNIHFEFGNELDQWERFHLIATIAMEIQNSLLRLLIEGVKNIAGYFLLVSVHDLQIKAADGGVIYFPFLWSKQVFLGGDLDGSNDIFPSLLIDVHHCYKLKFNLDHVNLSISRYGTSNFTKRYLKEHGYTESFLSLENESKVCICLFRLLLIITPNKSSFFAK